MKIAYFNCFAGAGGDMILGALMDAGLPLETLRAEIAKLHLGHYELGVEQVQKKGIGGSQTIVKIDGAHHHQHHRHLSQIVDIINNSELAEAIKTRSVRIFSRLAEAEAKVHRIGVEQVHFHEVGAMDAIIDVVGSVAGLHALGIERVICSPLHVGSGTVTCAHGTLPVPTPATAELTRAAPVYSTGVDGELLTPTGAAILTSLASDFGPMPAMVVAQIGYGAGASDPAIPNLLRVSIGESAGAIAECDMEQVAVVETNIDDMNPQMYDYVIQQAFDMEALDIYLTAVRMKKNRSGTVVTIICAPERVPDFARFLLRETTTIGMRWRIENRMKAKRTIKAFHTPYGPIHFKFARMGAETVNISPEYDDCKRAAIENGVPLKQVIDTVKAIVAGQTQGD